MSAVIAGIVYSPGCCAASGTVYVVTEVMAPFSILDSVLEPTPPATCKPGIEGSFGNPLGCTFSNFRDRVAVSPRMRVSRSNVAVNWAKATAELSQRTMHTNRAHVLVATCLFDCRQK